MDHTLPIAIIGAGPVGLAAAVHVLNRGETPIIFEAGDRVGHSIGSWRHVRMFSPWELDTDRAAVAMLKASGWQHPPAAEIPTGGEFVDRYLEPLAELPALQRHLHLHSRVTAVGRRGFDKVKTAGRTQQPFILRVLKGDGSEQSFTAKAVIDASGTWTSPNPIGAGGLPAIGEAAASDRIVYGIPDVLGGARARYANRTVAVVGSGHSAVNALLDLGRLREAAPGTNIVWILRRDSAEGVFGGGGADRLAARGELGIRARKLVESGAVTVVAPFRIERIERTGGRLALFGLGREGREQQIEADEIIAATGFRPDVSFLREIRLTLDPWLESAGEIGPLIDPNLHSCGTVRPHGFKELRQPEENFFIVGMKSYGRAPTFLTATGYEQVRSIVAGMTGDLAAAGRVELKLPETGVCSAAPAKRETAGASSCRGARAPVTSAT
jgi:thioredoxin reductase